MGCSTRRLLRTAAAAIGAPLYVLVEKILARYEMLPDWPIAGSTGYDFVNQVLAIFVDPAGEAAMTRLYRRFTARRENFDDVLYACKKRIMQVNLASEMNVRRARVPSAVDARLAHPRLHLERHARRRSRR